LYGSERKASLLFVKDVALIDYGSIMDMEPLIKLTWRGRETVESVPSLLQRAEQIEIHLPPGYNHSLFCLLHPHAPPSQLENIDVSGGPQLLERVASIKGLEAFRALIESLNASGATVQVLSPPKVLITRPGVKPARAKTKQVVHNLTGL
jgi:hypothetical protein